MNVHFVYLPEMEEIPLRLGLGGANDSTVTAFAERAIAAGVDIDDAGQVAGFASNVVATDNIDMPKAIERIGTAWNAIETHVSDRFEKMFATEWKPGEIIGYLTLSQRCPYRYPKCFWINYGTKVPVARCLHEIQHFYAHELVQPLFVSEGKEGYFNSFKESLTTLLNVDFADILEREDKGYPQHTELRKNIETKYRQGYSIDSIAKEYLQSI